MEHTNARNNSEEVSQSGTSERAGRRAFMVGVGKKAAYITPLVLTLAAAPASASPFAASCKAVGLPCTRNASCCTRNCDSPGTNLCV